MAYGRFDVPKDWITLTPDQVAEYSTAAEGHYRPDFQYHGWGHALDVAHGTEVISDKLQSRGYTIVKGALAIAGAWHDAGYHEDHMQKGFDTKEEYSASLLEKYLENRPMGEFERAIALNAIVATWSGFEGARTPYELILHRADIANIGGPEDEFLANSVKLWQERILTSGKQIAWDEYVADAVVFIAETIEEHDQESLHHFIDPSETVLDVNEGVFKDAAYRNMGVLLKYDPSA